MILVVGDPHITPDEIEDGAKMLAQIYKILHDEPVDGVVFMGDLYNTHDVLSVKVVDFWLKAFDKLASMTQVVAIRGNHDQTAPHLGFPHALSIHGDRTNVTIVDTTMKISIGGHEFVAAPYYHDTNLFAEEVNPWVAESKTLLCHQTFQGAKYENGFFAKDAVDLSLMKYDSIISGHIHTSQQCGKCLYVGSPRWRTASDANVDKYLWAFSFKNGKASVLNKYPSETRKIWSLVDDGNFKIPTDAKPQDIIRVEVKGSNTKEVKERAEALISLGCRVTTSVDNVKTSDLTESGGVDAAFRQFFDAFVPPNGTPKDELEREINA